MNRLLNVIIIIVCCILLLANLYSLVVNKDKDNEITKKYSMVSYNLSQVQTIDILQLKSEQIPINCESFLLSESGDSISAKLLLQDTNKFIIRFNDAGCTTCIEDFLNHLPDVNRFIEEIGRDNVLVLLNTENPRNITTFKKRHGINCDIYAIPVGKINIPIELQDEIVSYYYFVVSDNKFTNCFISIKELSERTQHYLESIRRRFASSN